MSEQLIFKKMVQVMKEIGPVTKDQKNTAQGFKFRGIDQFVNALHPALVKHGVFMAPRCTKFETELKDVIRSSGKAGIDKHVELLVEYDFFAEDGSKVTIGPIPAEGLDSGDKATNKALSAALKYALIQTFTVPTEDMAEADFETPEIGKSFKTENPLNSLTVATPLPTVTNVGSSAVASPPAAAASSTVSAGAPRRSSFRRPAAPVTNGGPAKPVEAATQSDGWD